MINLAEHLPPNPDTVNREEVKTYYLNPWHKEFIKFCSMVGSVRSKRIDITKHFPQLLSRVDEQTLYNMAVSIHKDIQRRYERTRERGHKPKMFPLCPQATEYASPETILIYLESNPDV